MLIKWCDQFEDHGCHQYEHALEVAERSLVWKKEWLSKKELELLI